MNATDTLKIQEKELAEFIFENKFSGKEVIVLEKNENSFLVPICTKSTQEFFEKIFSPKGSFWRAYKELMLAELPIGKKYVFILGNQLYFCKNIEVKYIYTAGATKYWRLKNNVVVLKKHINLDWLLRTLSLPFDGITHTKNVVVDAFKINELFLSFAEEIKDSKKSLMLANENTISSKQAEMFLNKAANVMFYSFLASLGQHLKLAPSEKLTPIIDETKKFFEKINFTQKIVEKEFFGENLYDISLPRLGEGQTKFSPLILPQDDWMILREAARLACARHLYAERKAYLAARKELGIGEKVFHLQANELRTKEISNLKRIAEERNIAFTNNKNLLPKRLFYAWRWFFEEENTPISLKNKVLQEFEGLNAGAKITVKGPVGWVHNETDLKKNFNGKIIITDYFSPNLVVTYAGALGVISSVGGILSHPAIVAREKNMPCILQVQGLSLIKENEIIELDGNKGKACRIQN